jgi:hypothetical protein
MLDRQDRSLRQLLRRPSTPVELKSYANLQELPQAAICWGSQRVTDNSNAIFSSCYKERVAEEI